mgnify:CR=1 FL=1
MHWHIIDELPVLCLEAWGKKLDRGIGYRVSLRPCAHEGGLCGWALIHTGFEGPESLLAVWFHAGEPDWVAEIDDCEIDLEEIGLDKADLEEINEFLRRAL